MSSTDHFHTCRCLRIHWPRRLYLLVWSSPTTPERATNSEGWKSQYGCSPHGHYWPRHYSGWNRSIQSIQLGISSSFSYKNLYTSNASRPGILVLRSSIQRLCIDVERSRDQPIADQCTVSTQVLLLLPEELQGTIATEYVN